MAMLLTTRHWGSDESFTCLGKTYASKFIQSQEKLKNDKSIPMSGKLLEENPPGQLVKRKALNVASKIPKSKTTKGYSGIVLEPSHVCILITLETAFVPNSTFHRRNQLKPDTR